MDNFFFHFLLCLCLRW